ncbi:MAG: glucokinase, partial [Pseudomonadota bacterium]
AWAFSAGDVARATKAVGVELINDYTATALSLGHLADGDVVKLGPDLTAEASEPDVRLVLGPGTGLGVSARIAASGAAPVGLATEGGHAAFAPADEFEWAIAQRLRGRFGRVSYERLLSGEGLCNLYAAISDINGASPEDLEPSDVTARALAGVDTCCVAALNTFCAVLGACAGDLALAYGARGGVYFGGGILPRMTEFVQTSDLRRRFEDKGRFRDYVAAIPTRLIVHPYAALLGAAAHLHAHLATETPS